jgi:hypothetical protein
MLGKYGKLQLTIQNDNYQEKRDPPPPSGNRNGVILPIHGSILKVKEKTYRIRDFNSSRDKENKMR